MKVVYKANDGSIFDNADTCREYEKDLHLKSSKNKLITLCSDSAMKSADVQAEHIIKNVKEFAIAMAPFLKD